MLIWNLLSVRLSNADILLKRMYAWANFYTVWYDLILVVWGPTTVHNSKDNTLKGLLNTGVETFSFFV